MKSKFQASAVNWVQRKLLKLVLGSQYGYMVRTLAQDPRTRNAYMADIVIRKDGVERRIEADWIKHLARITHEDVKTFRPTEQY